MTGIIAEVVLDSKLGNTSFKRAWDLGLESRDYAIAAVQVPNLTAGLARASRWSTSVLGAMLSCTINPTP